MMKIVRYDEYCPTCKYEKLDGNEEPCDTCLNNPINTDSRKPINWREK